jgi:hypothetical protein
MIEINEINYLINVISSIKFIEPCPSPLKNEQLLLKTHHQIL